jgi:hypothetical protein
MMAMTGSSLFWAQNTLPAVGTPKRLAIYYGYPSLVNGSRGDVEKAASVFSSYDVVVLGDGLEFPDRQPDRYPAGDPAEHQKVLRILTAVRARSPETRFFGYVCLGEISLPNRQTTWHTAQELEQRIRLWKQMGVAGIFLDEAGYDFTAVTRQRQNLAVRLIHDLGLSAFMNAYFLDHLFSREDELPHANGRGKNPEHAPPLLDGRDLFLLESFLVVNGAYEEVPAWRARLEQALEYRRLYKSRIFATTTTTEQEPMGNGKYGYAWWTAHLFDLDGFAWGEPNFSATSNGLPERRCPPEATLPQTPALSSAVGFDGEHFWRKMGSSLFVTDTRDHSVRRFALAGPLKATDIAARLRAPQSGSRLTCGDAHD